MPYSRFRNRKQSFGELSHRFPLPKNARFTGILSQFSLPENSIFENKYNPYGLDKDSFILYKVREYVPGVIQEEIFIQKDKFTLSEVLTNIPLFNKLNTLVKSSEEQQPLQTTKTTTPIPTPTPKDEKISKKKAEESIHSFESEELESLSFKDC